MIHNILSGNNTVGLNGNTSVDGKLGLVVVGSEDSTAVSRESWVCRRNDIGASLKQGTSRDFLSPGSNQFLPGPTSFLRVPVPPGFRLQLLTDPGRLFPASPDLSTAD